MKTSPSFAGVEVIRKALSTLPASAGVYRMIDAKGMVLYVGKARNLKNRVANYTHLTQLPDRLKRMVFHTTSMEFITTASEAEALLLEANLIKRFQPRYNILLKDDKSYPYILITGNHPFPRIMKHRGEKTLPGDYLGPFISAGAVNETIAFFQRAFLLRPCSDEYFKNRTRPCLQYQIKRCSGPCAGLISEEEYARLIQQARDFLSGKTNEIQERLSHEMQELSDSMQFEQAASLRDRIRALSSVQQQSAQYAAELWEADIVAFAREGRHVCIQLFCYRQGRNYGNQTYFPAHAEEREDGEIMAAFMAQHYAGREAPKLIMLTHMPQEAEVIMQALSERAGHKVEMVTPQRGEKRKHLLKALENTQAALQRRLSEAAHQEELLEGVARIFGMEAAPRRIEVYDNSHIMGAHAVGGMIVAGPEGFMRRAYRKFTIKDMALTPGDDYGMLREVLTRRFRKLCAEDWEGCEKPDLVLIDGGAGQLSIAQGVMESLGIEGITLASIAKGPDRNAGREWFHRPGHAPFQLPVNDATLHYLQRLRDEAHRYAIGFHRSKRSKAIRMSELDGIPSIGASRKKALLHHFGSARAISGASVEDIMRTPGINKAIAQKIYNYFH